METKKCFKCGVDKPLTEFYKHPAMTDGHLGKCKNCAKKDVREKYLQNISNPEYVDKERQRGREKYRRLGYVTRETAHVENKQTAKRMKPFIPEDHECHHWNYNLPNDIFIIARRKHKLIHKYMKFDKETKMFINSETGELLDSREKHYDFIVEVFRKNGHVETELLYAKRA